MIVLSKGRPVRVHRTIDLDTLFAAVEESQVGMTDEGFCIACGASRFQVEPDARNYECDSCGADEVFGAEEILMEVAG
jgi:hypothetical protein